MLKFEWDARKAAANLHKHGIDFEEATSAFYDDQARVIDDPLHSVSEERFLLLGMTARLRLVVVSHCLRRQGEVIRVISARKASAGEAKHYPSR